MTDGKLRRENGAAVKKKRGSFGPTSRSGISCQAWSELQRKDRKRSGAETPHEVIESFCDGDHPVSAAVVNFETAMRLSFKSTATVTAGEPHADNPH